MYFDDFFFRFSEAQANLENRGSCITCIIECEWVEMSDWSVICSVCFVFIKIQIF